MVTVSILDCAARLGTLNSRIPKHCNMAYESRVWGCCIFKYAEPHWVWPRLGYIVKICNEVAQEGLGFYYHERSRNVLWGWGCLVWDTCMHQICGGLFSGTCLGVWCSPEHQGQSSQSCFSSCSLSGAAGRCSRWLHHLMCTLLVESLSLGIWRSPHCWSGMLLGLPWGCSDGTGRGLFSLSPGRCIGRWGEGLWKGLQLWEWLKCLPSEQLGLYLLPGRLCMELASLLDNLPECLGNLVLLLREGHWGLRLHLHRAM